MTGDGASGDEAVRWDLDGPVGCLVLRSGLLQELIETVVAGFRRAPWGGPEVGGVLFGTREEGRVRVLAHRPIDCEHAAGPAFELSDADQRGLAQLLAEGMEGLEPAGWYHSKYRDCTMSASSAAVFERHFSAPWQVTLIFGRDRDLPCVTEVYWRRRNGTLQSVRPQPATREAAPAAEPAPPLPPPPAAVPEPALAPALPATAPNEVFWSKPFKDALGRLLYSVRGRKGLAVLTGNPGAGKTTLIKCLGEHLCEDRVEFAFLLNSLVSVPQFYEMLAYDLALDCPCTSRSEVVAALTRLMEGQAARGLTTALLIDDAHNLKDEVLREIHWLDSLPSRKEKRLQIILAGQPQLETRLGDGDLRPLQQQVAVHCALRLFSEPETSGFLSHLLANAGIRDRDVFPPELAGEIHRCCQGAAGTIRAVCDQLLRLCAGRGSRAATMEMLEQVCSELRLKLEHA